jgi:CubicO group peptidase (beta-lactamase class C family)
MPRAPPGWYVLGMGDTKISLTAGDLDRFTAHYWPKVSRVERRRWLFGEVCAFAGLASSVPDLARVVSMHLGARTRLSSRAQTRRFPE